MLLFKPIIHHTISSRDLIIITMFIVSTVTIFVCKIEFKDIKETPLFKSGAESLVVVLGIVWLSSTIIGVHVPEIKDLAQEMLREYPALLAVVFSLPAQCCLAKGRPARC